MSLYCKGRSWDGFWRLEAIAHSSNTLKRRSQFESCGIFFSIAEKVVPLRITDALSQRNSCVKVLNMVPLFNANGQLPPGIHFCDWEEFIARFGTTPHRLNLIAGLKLAMTQLRAAGCPTVYIDGSFVTYKLVPGDFDACWEANGVDMIQLKSIAPALLMFDAKRAAQKAAYGGEFFPAGWPADSVGTLFLEFFQMDRDGSPKGIIAIDLVRWQP
jgi:hypothetical protein